MSTQRIAMLFGVVFVLVGVLGFALTGFGMDMQMLLGIFPVNLVHNLVHILIGVWGVAAARSAAGATMYCRLAGVLYLILGCLGFVVDNPMGLVPIGGNDRYLHLTLGVILAGFGLMGGGAQKAAA